jgi:two-component sensor histidine kinase
MLEWRARLELGSESAAELVEAMAELHALSTKLISCATAEEAIAAILDAAMSLHDAQFGNVQLIQPITGNLEIVAHRGFDEEYLKVFRTVSMDDPCSCGRALRTKSTIFIEDVTRDPEYAPFVGTALKAGYRAVQSTPMINSEGNVIGVISTHFRDPHVPGAATAHITSLFAQQAADMIGQLREVEKSAERQKILTGELSHRVKNILMMVLAVSRKTKWDSADLNDYHEAFESRVIALSNAHNALRKFDWRKARLDELLKEQFAEFNPKAVFWNGPAVLVKPDTVYVLTLVLHELAVNAHKYGALSTAGGKVMVEWAYHNDDDMLVIQWNEIGGKGVAKPKKAGFGSALLRNLADSGLISSDFRYEPDGLKCTLRLPDAIAEPSS